MDYEMKPNNSNKANEVSPELIRILCCPLCKSSLTREKNQLKCRKCKRIYPIKDGMPIMTP
jgi:uncharacterized protein YbaR (Trm112 family)